MALDLFQKIQKISNEKEMQNFLLNFENKKNSKIFINFPYYNAEAVKVIKKFVSDLKKKGYDFESKDIYIDCGQSEVFRDKTFTKEECENLVELEEYVWNKDGNLAFKNSNTPTGLVHSLDQILNASNQINETSKKINSLNLSPFEKFMMAYDYVSNRIYKESTKSFRNSRDLIAIMNGDEIVCEGYANLLKVLCDKIGVDCLVQRVYMHEPYNGSHACNVVYLKDEKYGINGVYYADACFDSREKDDVNKRFLHCLVPLNDVNNMLTKIDIESNDYLNYLYDDFDIDDKERALLDDFVPMGYEASKFVKKVSGVLKLGTNFSSRSFASERVYIDLKQKNYDKLMKYFKNNDKKYKVMDPYISETILLRNLALSFTLDSDIGKVADLIEENFEVFEYESKTTHKELQEMTGYEILARIKEKVVGGFNSEKFEEDIKFFEIETEQKNLRSNLFSMRNHSEPIELDKYREAYRTYLGETGFKGDINKKVEDTIKYNVDLAEFVYKTDASNCFMKNSIIASKSNKEIEIGK